MTIFNWTISKLITTTTNTHLNVVVFADVAITGSRGVHQSGVVKNVQFELDAEKTFVPFESLTEKMVLGWVFEQLNEGEQSFIRNSIDAELDIMETPLPKPQPQLLIEQKLPWA